MYRDLYGRGIGSAKILSLELWVYMLEARSSATTSMRLNLVSRFVAAKIVYW